MVMSNDASYSLHIYLYLSISYSYLPAVVHSIVGRDGLQSRVTVTHSQIPEFERRKAQK